MVKELLNKGEDSAVTGKTLARILNCDIRIVTMQIELERREGAPICATGNGYFLAETEEELEAYCNALYRRAGELFKTRRALLSVLKQYAEQREE